MPRIALLVCCAALLCAAPAGATPGSAPVPFPASGQVLDAVVEGDTAYVAGYLRAVGSAPGPLTILNATGTVRRTFPEITSNGAPEELHNEGVVPDLDVLALEPDGAGGFYVGGEFDKVLGQRRVNLVHLRADGTIDPVFSAQALGPVRALEVRGDALFVGGGFTVIGGELRTSLAKLDARTGEVLDWGPAAGIAPISDLSISGDRLYAAGSGRGATAFDLATGRVLDWDPELGTSTDLSAIAARDDRVFLGGDFDEVHGEERSGAVLVGTDDAATLSPWVFRAGEVTQIELGPQVVVMLGGRLQNDEVTLRAYDLSTGERRPWFGDLARTAQGITTEGETLYVATESEIAAFDLRTGARLPYRGASDGRVLAAGGGALAAAGGGLRDTVARVGAAAVDLRTNAVLPFDAQVAGAVMHRVPYYEGPWVSAVEKAGDTVYLGGVFATVGGRPQQSLAAVDATTGAWRPGFPTVTGGPVNALAVSGTTLFVGGDFAELGGRPVTRLGAIDLATGQVHAWAPSLPWGCPVTAMEVVGPTLFVGACGLRAYDVATRAALPLTGQPSMAVHALEPDGLGGIWVGGKASGDGDVHLRHIDANGFNVPYAVTDGPVDEIEAAGAELFLAGAFSEIAGERRWNLGSIDLSTGRATRFRPEPGTSPWVSNDVTMLEALPGGGLLVGGGFQYLAAAAVPGLARFAPGGETSPPTPRGPAPVVVGGVATGSLQWVYGGDFAGNPSVEVRWERCAGATCTDAGQVGWSYNLRDADAGHRMRAVLVAHNDAGSFELETAPGPVALGPKPFAIYPAYPYMYGEPRVGATLTMADGLWDPAPTSQRYTWTRCDYDVGCRPIPGATGRTYTTTSADAGQRIRATVYAINAAGERAFSAQEEIGPIVANPPGGSEWGKIPTPTFGSKVGDFLYGDRHIGSQSSSGRIGWLRCDASGANCTRLATELQAYELQPADQGHTFRQTLTTYTTSGESPERTSEPSPVIGPPYVPTPTPTPNPDPPPTPVPTPPANSWPTGTSTPVPTSTPASPGPTVTASPGPTISPASPDPTASPAPTATPDLPGAPLPEPTRSPLPGRTGSPATAPAPRVTATLLRDGRVRLRADAKGTVIVRVRDKKTKRVVARRTVKVAKGTKTVRVGKARRGVYVEVAWR